MGPCNTPAFIFVFCIMYYHFGCCTDVTLGGTAVGLLKKEGTMASGHKTSADFKSTFLKTRRAQDVRKDTEKIMKAYVNWEEFIMPASTSVSILGHLVFISSTQDFSLNHKAEDKKFEFLKYPESFRACLMQVCNSGWKAFNTAHKNMDQIRLYSLNVLRTIQMVAKTLMQENDAIVTALLPAQLRNVEHVSNECYQLASEVEQEFMNVIDVISELMEAVIFASKKHDEPFKEAEQAIEEAEIMKISAEEAKDLANKTYEDMERRMQEAQEAYKDAMSNLPGGWEMFGLALVESLKDCLSDSFHSSSPLMQKIFKCVRCNQDSPSQSDDQKSSAMILSKTDQLNMAAYALTMFVFQSGNIRKSELYDKRTKKFRTDFSKARFMMLKEQVKDEEPSSIKTAFLNSCEMGIKICDDLELVNDNLDVKHEKCLADRINSLVKDSEKLYVSSTLVSHRPPLNAAGPHMAKAANEHQPEETIVRTMINLAQFRVEQAKAQLHHTDAEFRARFEVMKQSNKELDDILIMLGEFKLEKIQTSDTIIILSQGLKALGKAKEQWSKLAQLFQMISNLIKTCLNQKMNQFVEECRGIPAIEGYSHSGFIKDLIYQQTFQASNVASLIHMISDNYVTVSRNHLMDRVSALGTLMSLKSGDKEFEKARIQLSEDCQATKKAIEELVKKNVEEFSESIEERINTIDNNLKDVLPPASEERLKEIECNYEKGADVLIQELSKDEEDQFY